MATTKVSSTDQRGRDVNNGPEIWREMVSFPFSPVGIIRATVGVKRILPPRFTNKQALTLSEGGIFRGRTAARVPAGQ